MSGIDVPDNVTQDVRDKLRKAAMEQLQAKVKKDWAFNDLAKKKPWLKMKKESRNSGRLTNLKRK